MEKVRRAAIVYYFAQGIAVGLWWLVMVVAPQTQLWFRLDPDNNRALYAFWLGDLLLIMPGSVSAAVMIYFRWKHALLLVWLVNGAVAYATFYALAYALGSDFGWLGVGLMFAALLWSGVFAIGLTFGGQMFRKSQAGSENFILLKTFAQIVIVWSVILALIPLLITVFEARLGITPFSIPMQVPVAAVSFFAISGLGVLAAITMSRLGKGTPLPLDHAANLVVSGPYSYVRNPMALSGIGQGLAVALFLGSPLVVLYTLMGSAIWQLVFRPLEEDDLEKRFGATYRDYRSRVKCWRPNIYRYSFPDDRQAC